jgi:hypothetical protein
MHFLAGILLLPLAHVLLFDPAEPAIPGQSQLSWISLSGIPQVKNFVELGADSLHSFHSLHT